MNTTKSVRAVTFKDLQQFLTIFKDITNTNWCFISTMVNHVFQWRTIVKPLHNKLPQIIPKFSTNIMILIHGQPRNTQHKSLQSMNLSLVNHLHQFSFLCPHNFWHKKSSTKGKEGCPLSKGLELIETAQLIDLWCSRSVVYNTSLPDNMDKNKKSQAITEISEEMGIEQDLIGKKWVV